MGNPCYFGYGSGDGIAYRSECKVHSGRGMAGFDTDHLVVVRAGSGPTHAAWLGPTFPNEWFLLANA